MSALHQRRAAPRRRAQRGNATLLFLLLVAGAGFFVWWTSGELPERVASHFGAAGQPNGYMPHEVYARFMLVLVVGAPLLMAILPAAALNSPKARFNLPNRDYWLAPERRAATLATLRRFMLSTAAMLAVFLAYVHWLVVRANQVQPPSLPMPWFTASLVAFVAGILGCGVMLVLRFRKVPP